MGEFDEHVDLICAADVLMQLAGQTPDRDDRSWCLKSERAAESLGRSSTEPNQGLDIGGGLGCSSLSMLNGFDDETYAELWPVLDPQTPSFTAMTVLT